MTNIKQQVCKILDQLPDNCSIKDVQYHLYVAEAIRQRSELADRGEFASETEVEQKLWRWLFR